MIFRRIAFLLLFGFSLAPGWGQGLDIESRYSPLNRQRSPRQATEYIILHTTEGGGRGSLEKLRRFGEAHYMVDTDGKVYRIIEHRRIATHAGRSMWNGRTNLDNRSIGVEVVGYHDRPITAAQKRALRELLRQLKGIYNVSDDRVLPHSMVAYGRPNRWHRTAHRGRKRCGMQFANVQLRREIGLSAGPRQDPDVRAGRLVAADDYLERVLFGPAARRVEEPERPEADNVISRNLTAWDIARERYNAASTRYEFPDGTVRRGDEISQWNRIPPGTVVRVEEGMTEVEETRETERVLVIGRDGAGAREIASGVERDEKTIYFLTDGRVLQGHQLSEEEVEQLPRGTGVLVGYKHGGSISANRRAFDIVGPRWNLSTTFYRFPDGSIQRGDAINERGIPNRTMVFFQP